MMSPTDMNKFEDTELKGVLPSIGFIIEHLEQFDDQFALSIKHLRNAGTSVFKTAVKS